MQLEELEREIKDCKKCESSLHKYGVVPRPIFSGGIDYPIFLLGQAPGRTEYEKNAPFQGGAGKTIKTLFADCGLKDFDKVVYQTSVTKCFPGRCPGSSTDRVPTTQEVKNCLPHLANQLELVKPKLLVCLGGLAWKACLTMKEADSHGFCLSEFGITKPSAVRVPDVVGRRFTLRSIIVLPMIHPAGSANGARARYPGEDKKSKELLNVLLSEIGVNEL